MTIDTEKLVTAAGLLEALFEERFRPSVRWLREQQRRRNIPYIKIGHSVFFDVPAVRRALEERKTIRARPQRTPRIAA